MPWLVECPGIAILGLEPAWLILTLFDLNADARKLEGRKAAWARNAVLINAARDRRYHSNLDLASSSGKTVSAPPPRRSKVSSRCAILKGKQTQSVDDHDQS